MLIVKRGRIIEKNRFTKITSIALIFLSLIVLVICYTDRKNGKAISFSNNLSENSNDNNQTEIAVRPATPDDYAYYLKVYPDLEIDQPPVDEALWNKRDMPNVIIITQNTQSVGYIWALKHDEVYCLKYFIIGNEHRRKGIGTRALKYLKKYAMQLGYNRWGLVCDVNHSIPYKMYLKAGMNRIGEYYHLKAPYSPSLGEKSDLNIIVIYDPEQWPILEEKYGVMKGRTRLIFPSGALPILLVDPKGKTRGFVTFLPSAFKLYNLVVDSNEDFMVFLGLLQELKSDNSNPEWIHFWIETGKQYSDIILSSIPSATICERYDYLEGNTLE